MPRFSANLGFLWPDRPLLDRVDAAAHAGFQAIELHWPYDVPADAIRRRAAAHDLEIVALNTATGSRPGDFGLGAQPGREREFAASFDEALAYAETLRAAAIHVMAGLVRPGDEEPARETFLANLARITPIAESAGLTLLLEPINRRDRPGYFYDRIEEAAALIRELGNPALKLMFDCYHVGITEGEVIRRMEEFWPLIGHIQIAGVPNRAEPDEGELDYSAVFAAIDRLGYVGWVGAEYKPRGKTEDGLAWLGRSVGDAGPKI